MYKNRARSTLRDDNTTTILIIVVLAAGYSFPANNNSSTIDLFQLPRVCVYLFVFRVFLLFVYKYLCVCVCVRRCKRLIVQHRDVGPNYSTKILLYLSLRGSGFLTYQRSLRETNPQRRRDSPTFFRLPFRGTSTKRPRWFSVGFGDSSRKRRSCERWFLFVRGSRRSWTARRVPSS